MSVSSFNFLHDTNLKNSELVSGLFHYKMIPLFRDKQSLGLGVHQMNNRGLKWIKKFERNIELFELDKSIISNYFQEKDNPRYALDSILLEALDSQASDIHFFKQQKDVRVLIRNASGLIFLKNISHEQFLIMSSLIKYYSHLDQSIEHRPQQSSFLASHLEPNLFIRVAVLPTLYGQDIVLRLFSKHTRFQRLASLGFSNTKLKILKNMIHQDSGIILVTGPTGSGKTTTLYALVKEIIKNKNRVVASLEDPIECEIEGLRQSQVDPAGFYTYAKGLKALLRQDPDVILVGEIRDKETAAIAFQAAFTGHLVLSSCHTQDVFSTLTRLQQLEVDQAYIQGAVKGIISQKLIPCENKLRLNAEILFCENGISDKSIKDKNLLKEESCYLY